MRPLKLCAGGWPEKWISLTVALVQFQIPLNRWLKKSKTQLSSITPSRFHQASRDTCLLANKYQFIYIHLLAIIQFWTGELPMKWYRLGCWQVSIAVTFSSMPNISSFVSHASSAVFLMQMIYFGIFGWLCMFVILWYKWVSKWEASMVRGLLNWILLI